MKNISIGAVALMGSLAFSATANADWNGMYGGVNVGLAEVNYSLTDIDQDWHGATLNRTKMGLAGGGTFGFNKQNGNFVYGIEADINLASVKTEDRYDNDVNITQEMKWFGTVRGRAGVGLTDAMLYVTGGLAIAKFEQSWIEDADPADSWTELGKTAMGYVTGAGVEFAASKKDSFKFEVLQMSFNEWGKHNDNGFDMRSKPTATLIRGGWNFKF